MERNENRVKVLFVEDEETILKPVKKYLEMKAGYFVVPAVNGSETIKAIEEESFDVVILDLKLPDIDGRTLLKKIKECMPGIKVIVTTGDSTASNIDAERIVYKPFSLSDVLDAVREVVGG